MKIIKNFSPYYKYITFLSLIGLVIYRSPELLLYPRFWAEEGTVYFKNIYESHWLEGLFFIPKYTAEYLSLAANLPLTIASHAVPLEYATTISTYFSLLIFLIPFIIILWGRSHLWDSPFKKILACAILLLAPTSTEAEIWLNTINLQVHCGLISFCILFEKLEQPSIWRRWFYRFMLLFCGLSGPYTAFLVIVFLIKMGYEKSRDSRWHFAIVFGTSIIQALILILIHLLDLNNPHKIENFDWIKAPIYIFNHHIMTPLLGLWVRLGPNIEDVIKSGQLQGNQLIITSLISTITLVVLLYWLTKKSTSIYRILLLITFLTVSLLTTYGSIDSTPYGRYAVVPGFLFLLLILDNISSRFPFNLKSLFLLALLIISFVMGFTSFQEKRHWMAYIEGAPKWWNEIAQWRQNPAHRITSWPFPWHDASWQFYLSDRQKLSDLKHKFHNINKIELVSQGNWVEKTINVNGLPVDFHLTFTVEVTGHLPRYEASLAFFSDQDLLTFYSITDALHQQNAAILDFSSIDHRTLPLKPVIRQGPTVKKISILLKSKDKVKLVLSDFKVTAHDMSVF